jgi:hypothetical protein
MLGNHVLSLILEKRCLRRVYCQNKGYKHVPQSTLLLCVVYSSIETDIA